MNSKLAKIGAFVAIFLGFASPFAVEVYRRWEPAVPAIESTEIIGAQTAVVGEMLRLSIDGDEVEWKSLPENKNIQVFGDRNENLVVSFEQPGSYNVIAAATKDGKLKVSVLTIVVSASGTVVAPPVTSNPSPQPPITVPSGPVSGLAEQVKGWCTTANVNKATAKTIATNFATVANEISLGTLKERDEIIARTVELNTGLDLTGFESVMGSIQAHLTSASDSGSLVTPQQHHAVWESIAQGLNAYAI